MTTYKALNEHQQQKLISILSADELKVVVNERNSLAISQLHSDSYHNEVVDFISELKLVAGVILHEGQTLMFQTEMIKRFLLTGFPHLRKTEMVEAFYLNSTGKYWEPYVHYNKELNAEFLGNVLRAYCNFKRRFLKEKSDKILNVINPPKREPRVINYDNWKEIVQGDLDYLHGKSNVKSLWHKRKYYTVRQNFEIPFGNVDGWLFFIKKTASKGIWVLNLPDNVSLAHYKIGRTAARGLFKSQESFDDCVQVTREDIYWKVLNACKDCNIYDLFKEVR